MSEQWFYVDPVSRNTHGPCSAADLLEMRLRGDAGADLLVAREGETSWSRWIDAIASPRAFRPIPPLEKPFDGHLEGAAFDRLFGELTSESLSRNASEHALSQIALGRMHLRSGHAAQALPAFHSAIGNAARTPAAWIGKAWADALLVTVETPRFTEIHESIEEAAACGAPLDRLLVHYTAILALAGSRLAWDALDALRRWESESSEERKAKQEAAIAGIFAGVAGVVAWKSENRVWETLGWTSAAAAGGYAALRLIDARRLAAQAEGSLGRSIGAVILSALFVERLRSTVAQMPSGWEGFLAGIESQSRFCWSFVYERALDRAASALRMWASAAHWTQPLEHFREHGVGLPDEVGLVETLATTLGFSGDPVTARIARVHEDVGTPVQHALAGGEAGALIASRQLTTGAVGCGVVMAVGVISLLEPSTIYFWIVVGVAYYFWTTRNSRGSTPRLDRSRRAAEGWADFFESVRVDELIPERRRGA